VRTGWDEILQRARLRSPLLGRVLALATVRGVQGERLKLSVPEGESEARGTLRRREVHLAIGQITQQVVGTYLEPKVVDARSSRRSGAATGLDLRGHPAVVRVTEATGGRLLDVERRAPIRSPTKDEDGGNA
jgi:hypothetical protein